MQFLIKRLSEEEIKNLNIRQWPIWEKEISKFEWYYSEPEECYFLDGKVSIHYDGNVVDIQKGDFVIFPKGLKCIWEIKEPVRKHYNFK